MLPSSLQVFSNCHHGQT